jgi:hypothetical protein
LPAAWLIFRAAPAVQADGQHRHQRGDRIMGLIMMSLGIEIMVAGSRSLSRIDVIQVCLSEPVLVTGFLLFLFCWSFPRIERLCMKNVHARYLNAE